MGLNVCSCFRNIDDLSAETDLNGDAEIEGFNFPNNNHNIFSSTDDSTNLTGAGRMSYLMKVNTYDSGTIKNTAFCTLKTGAAVEMIQSVFRGSSFRKKFKKNIYERLNNDKNKTEKVEEKNNEEVITNGFKENDFINEKTKIAEKYFEDELDYENGWKKYRDNITNNDNNKTNKDNNKNSKADNYNNDDNNNNKETNNDNNNNKTNNDNNKENNDNNNKTSNDNNNENNENNNNNNGNNNENNNNKIVNNDNNSIIDDVNKIINNDNNIINNKVDENKEIFSQQKINDIIKNNKNLISTKEEGDFIIIDNEECLFKGQMEKKELNDNNIILEGKGELYLKNGVKYEGIFINGKLNGIGRYINDKFICYEGIFNDGVLEGKGTCIKVGEDGIKKIYKGDLKNYKKEGKGIITCQNYTYEGDLVDDKKQGKGKIIYNLNQNVYVGEFNNDDINGYGLYTFKNMHIYEGNFLNGQFHGKGTYKWPDGCYFKGEYINGLREGNGEYKFINGKIYKGPFTNGKPNGKGIIIVNGNNINCEFKNGQLLTDLKSKNNSKKKRKNKKA